MCGNVSGNMAFWDTGKSLTFDKYLCVEMYQETWRFGSYTGKSLTFDKYLCVEMYQETWRFGSYTGKSLTFDKYLCVEMYQETWCFEIQEINLNVASY